jgi:hypothetical protein
MLTFLYILLLFAAVLSICDFLPKYKFKITYLFPRSKRVSSGDELAEALWILAFNESLQRQQTKFPIYKGYEDLLNFLLLTVRGHGGSVRAILDPLKKSLLQDLKWEKKLLAEYKDGIFQFVLTGIITWAFSLFASYLLEISLSFTSITMILIIQSLGIAFFHHFILLYERKYFDPLFLFSKKLIQFEALLKTKLSVQEILEESEICRIEISDLKADLRSMAYAIARIVKRWKNYGDCVSVEVLEIIEDLSFRFEQNFGKFLDTVKFLKFITLCLFFLTPYFLMIGTVLSSFLIE